MNTQKKATSVRLAPAMREELQKRAEDNGRTLNGEIAFRLRKSLEQEAATGQVSCA